MTKKSLPATPSSYNDIESLSGILESNFQYKSNLNPSYKKEYMDRLNLVVGLGFTALLVRRNSYPTLQSDFNRFLEGFSFSSRSQCTSIESIALEAARILYEAAHSFPKIEGCPEFCEAFTRTLKLTVRSGVLDSDKNKALSERLLETLLRHHNLNPYF